ncbi:MAG TPA: FAD:protein FMN transferase [Verrucomicrobiae bacterium]|nr:FAD:protein FMN transferase [Verrucomicrobiae bacterium]
MFRSLIAAAIFLVAGCASLHDPGKHLQRFEFEEPQMGVPFRIVLYASDQAQAEAGADAAFRRIAQLNAKMSDYETDSEISRLSRSSEEGSPEVKVSEDLWKVLAASQRLSERSDGAFDITVGPCVALWRKARREKEMPDAARLENARGKVGFTNLILDEKAHTARLLKKGMRLDVGAIAKGYAADEAIKTLRQSGIRTALVAASGDLSLGDAPPGSDGWRVEIIGYDRPEGPPSIAARLANCGVATSGDLFQRLEIEGVRYSHILNPFTCVGMTNHALATVIAKDCMTADSLATASIIAESAASIEIADQFGAGVRIIRMEQNAPAVSKNRRFDQLTRSER